MRRASDQTVGLGVLCFRHRAEPRADALRERTGATARRFRTWRGASLAISAEKPAIFECRCATLAGAGLVSGPARERNQGSGLSGRGDGRPERAAGLTAGESQGRAPDTSRPASVTRRVPPPGSAGHERMIEIVATQKPGFDPLTFTCRRCERRPASTSRDEAPQCVPTTSWSSPTPFRARIGHIASPARSLHERRAACSLAHLRQRRGAAVLGWRRSRPRKVPDESRAPNLVTGALGIRIGFVRGSLQGIVGVRQRRFRTGSNFVGPLVRRH